MSAAVDTSNVDPTDISVVSYTVDSVDMMSYVVDSDSRAVVQEMYSSSATPHITFESESNFMFTWFFINL